MRKERGTLGRRQLSTNCSTPKNFFRPVISHKMAHCKGTSRAICACLRPSRKASTWAAVISCRAGVGETQMTFGFLPVGRVLIVKRIFIESRSGTISNKNPGRGLAFWNLRNWHRG